MDSKTKSILIGIMMTAASAVGFGLLPFFTSYAKAAGFNTWDCLAGRYLGSAFFLALLIKLRGHSIRTDGRHILKLSLVGIFAFGITSAFLLLGYMHAPTGKVTAIHFLYPTIVMLLSAATGREKLKAVSIAAAVVSLSGLLFISIPGGSGSMDGLGVLFSAASSVTFAIYVLALASHDFTELDNSVLVFYLSLSSGLFFLTIALVTAAASGHAAISLSVVPPMLGMVLLASAMPASLFSLGTRRLGPTASSILSMLEPVTAAVVGAVFLGETMSGSFAIGLILILIASTAISLSKMHSPSIHQHGAKIRREHLHSGN